MTPIRVLIAAMPQMLLDIVNAILASQEEIDIVGEVRNDDGLLQAAGKARADVVILSETEAPEPLDAHYRDLLYGLPRLKILAIAAHDRRGFLHQLQPHVIPLGELSPTVLLDAIRAAGRQATSPSTGQ